MRNGTAVGHAYIKIAERDYICSVSENILDLSLKNPSAGTKSGSESIGKLELGSPTAVCHVSFVTRKKKESSIYKPSRKYEADVLRKYGKVFPYH